MGLMDTGIPTWVQKIDFYEQAMKKLHFVLRERAKAKNEKDFARADMIRKLLADFGVTITDMPDGKVKPTTSFDRADLFFEQMSHTERRLKFGKLLGDDNKTIDALALVDVYLAHVADKVTEALSNDPRAPLPFRHHPARWAADPRRAILHRGKDSDRAGSGCAGGGLYRGRLAGGEPD